MSTPRVFRQEPYPVPPGATEILLVRHGASEPAVEGMTFPLADGHGDPALSDVGKMQAEQVGERLAGERIDAIYVTSLRRTHETAAPLATRLGLTPVVERELREVHLGDWEGGLVRAKMADQDPVAVSVFAEQRWELIPGAEPAEVFAERVTAGITRIAAAHPDGRVAVFAHGASIGEVLRIATGSEPFALLGADNASISVLVVHGERWRLRRFNDITHLHADVVARPTD